MFLQYYLHLYLIRNFLILIIRVCSPNTGPNENTNTEKKEETEEEVDFGYWESAILDDKPPSSNSTTLPAVSSSAQDVDLL